MKPKWGFDLKVKTEYKEEMVRFSPDQSKHAVRITRDKQYIVI